MKLIPVCLLFLLAVISSCNDLSVEENQKAKIHSWYDSAVQYRYGPYDSILYYAERIDSNSRNLTAEYQAMGDITYGAFYKGKSQYRLAMKKYDHAIQLLKDSKADSLIGKAETGYGNCKKQFADFDEAIKHLLLGLRASERAGNKEGIAGANTSIAQIYQQTGELDTAEIYLQRSLNILDKERKNSTYLIAMHTLANIYGMRGEIDRALAIDETGLRIADSLKKLPLKSMFLDNKALCFMSRNQFDSSLFYFREAMKIDSAADDRKQIADGYLNLGNLAMLQNKPELAEAQLKKSISIANEVGYRIGVTNAWDLLSQIWTTQKLPEKAAAAKDSVLSNYKKTISGERQANILELEALYDSEKKEEQILSQQAQIRQQKIITLGIIVISVMIILLGISYYRHFRQKKSNELKQEIRKQEEKATIAVFESEQNERIRIARDLHDSIGQMLAVIKMRLSAVNSSGADEKKLLELVDTTIREVRTISHNLIPEELNFGLTKALAEMAEKINAAGTTQAEFIAGPELAAHAFSDATAISVYRIVQEITGNMLKHAEARLIRIETGIRENVFICMISDDGKGMDSELILSSSGIGWRNVQTRIRLLNGTMQLKSEKGKGTLVEIAIPQ